MAEINDGGRARRISDQAGTFLVKMGGRVVRALEAWAKIGGRLVRIWPETREGAGSFGDNIGARITRRVRGNLKWTDSIGARITRAVFSGRGFPFGDSIGARITRRVRSSANKWTDSIGARISRHVESSARAWTDSIGARISRDVSLEGRPTRSWGDEIGARITRAVSVKGRPERLFGDSIGARIRRVVSVARVPGDLGFGDTIGARIVRKIAQRFTLGTADIVTPASQRLEWNGIGLKLNRALLATATTGFLHTINIQRASATSNFVTVSLLTSSTASGGGATTGPEMSAAFERSATALTIELAGFTVPIPGPASSLAFSRDTSEPYSWVLSIAALADAWTDLFNAYQDASASQKRATSATLEGL